LSSKLLFDTNSEQVVASYDKQAKAERYDSFEDFRKQTRCSNVDLDFKREGLVRRVKKFDLVCTYFCFCFLSTHIPPA
jgi:hypothetical protein